MKKNLFLPLAVAILAIAGNVQAISVKSAITVVNKTNADFFITANTVTSKCLHGCNYNRVKAGETYTPSGSLFGSLLTVAAPICNNGKPEIIKKDYRAETDKVEVTITNNELKFEDVGSTTEIEVKTTKKR